MDRINQKLEEEKMKKQNAKAMRVNEGRQEYQQFLVRKQVYIYIIQEERDMKKQKSNYNDQPFLSSEKQKYMSEKTHTGNSQNYQQLQQNNIQEQYNERNPSDLSNKTTPSHSYQGNNDYSNNVPNSDIYKPQNQGSYNMNNRGNNQDNQPKGEGVSPYQGYEELANLDFNDPNFDYNKYDELMQQYSKAMMQKEEEKKKEENEMKPTMYENQNNEDISQRMQNLNLNSNQQMNEDERKRMEFLQKEEEMYKQYQQEMLKQNDSFIPRNAPSSNPGAYDQYSKDLGPQERGEYQNIYQENPYSLQRGQTPQGITPSNIQQQPNNFQNRGPSIEYGVNPMHNINQQNEGSNNNLEYRHNNNTFQQQEMIHQNYNPYQQGQNVHQNHHQSMNQGQGRSNSQNPNRNNAQSYLNDREKLVNNFQYNQMIYQKNKANNYFSNITHNQYNFEKVATGEQKQNVNQGNQNFNPYQGNSNGQVNLFFIRYQTKVNQ